tara:strand:+ start:350 stop:799 length:450 start_codon:yes stop_codon:yes gene_type:complete
MSNKRISEISTQRTSEKDQELYEALLFHFQLNFKEVNIRRIICLIHPMGTYLDKNRMDFESWLFRFFYGIEKEEGVFYDIRALSAHSTDEFYGQDVIVFECTNIDSNTGKHITPPVKQAFAFSFDKKYIYNIRVPKSYSQYSEHLKLSN